MPSTSLRITKKNTVKELFYYKKRKTQKIHCSTTLTFLTLEVKYFYCFKFFEKIK